jgi:1-acyl-sn-glycerol-3-phosphate acyltransferase
MAMALLTGGWFTVWALGMLVAAPTRRQLFWRDRILFLWSRTLTWAIGIRVRHEGEPPARGCLLVSNHLSYVDVIVLASRRPMCFLSKADVKHWPVLGFMSRALGVHFIERENKRGLPAVAARLASELSAGHTLVVFPEGTTGPGREVMPFRSSVLAPAAEGELAVAVATLHYATPDTAPPPSTAVAWYGEMEFLPHLLGLFRLPRVEARVRFHPERIAESDRKLLANRLREAVVSQFEPLR